jgi:hypothetical protein
MAGAEGPEPDGHLSEVDRGWTLWRRVALRSAGLPIERLDVFAGAADPAGGDRVQTLRAARRTSFDALLSDERFLAALTWQNPEAVDDWAGEHAAALRAGEQPHVNGHRFGHRLAVVTRYAQRYCAKNDTIGFFGPVAWATLGGARSGYAGAGGIRRSEVYVEVWAVQSIAAAWNGDPELRDHLPVRLDPSCTVRGPTILRPYRRPLVLGDDEACVVAVLAAAPDRCGVRLAGLAADVPLSPGAFAAALERLCTAGAVRVGFRVPICSRPLDGLERQVAQIPDVHLRSARLGRIEGVRLACRSVAAAGDPHELRAALADAYRVLDEAAGVPVRREPGFAVGGRTPLYLDCRRDLDATIGDDVLDDLRQPLGVLLDSAHWLCGQVADAAEEALAARYRQLAEAHAEVTLSDLYLACADLLEPGGQAFADIVADFQLRWTEIIGRGAESIQVDPSTARRLADGLFPAPRRTWAAARLHSPDLLLRRRPDGSLSWVLGELHLALNTLESRFFSAQADDPDELVAAMAADVAPGRVVPIYPNSARDVSSRSYPPLSLDPPGHYRYISFGFDDGHPAGVHGTPATAITVTRRGGVLMASCAGEGWEAPVLECFGEQLSAATVNLFTLRRPATHAPRVTIGTVTVCRETWQVPLARLAGMARRDKDPDQDELRRWLAGLGVPRHVFARVPGDRKPFYVDLKAPVLADNLARAGRRSAATASADDIVQLVEMLPNPTELWLRLADGSYTSELRLVAVAPGPVAPASWSLNGR